MEEVLVLDGNSAVDHEEVRQYECALNGSPISTRVEGGYIVVNCITG